MKSYLSLLVLFLYASFGIGQTISLEKASPFTAVKWTDRNQPMVQFDDEWFALIKLDNHTTKELLDFCKKEFGDKWQKRFSEDLVEVLTKMGTPPSQKATLVLEKDSNQIQVTGTYSLENRQKVYLHNQQHGKKKVFKRITSSQAIEDIDQFYDILQTESSYIHLTDHDFKTAIDSLKAMIILKSMDSVDINYLTHELAKIMAEIGDRHSSVKNEWFEKKNLSTYNLQLPFSLASVNGKVVALRSLDVDGNYDYLHKDFPFVKSINGIPMDVFIDSMAYRSKKAPEQAKLSRGILEVQQLGSLYFKNNLELPSKIKIVFTNGKAEISETVSLVNKRLGYESRIERNILYHRREISKGNFQNIFKVLKGNIGYISLPQMFSFDNVHGLEAYIDSVLANSRNTKALIVDLRFNPGGTRDLLQKFAGHIIPESHSPWVANVAYLRTDKKEAVHGSMSARFLYTYNSNHFDDLDRKAIDKFSKSFATEKEFDISKFSHPHYMVLKGGASHYQHPVYMLANEHSFSAASVFISAFKGLPNVKIVGVTTDGSSGNSKRVHLNNSSIRLRVSTMLSFQRNGKTLDGNGTRPDLYFTKEVEQVLRGTDVQLQKLTEAINKM
ncbi:S41 family peptidase [Muricauda sp. 334s03]|uniref:S41 family peptidase n=1 Tax=Flagellimonas yonaguniensis TaxID=3031325 RepID=A0ABT5Y2K3_9FLAO|nr:S41 family peptidase [[Muricauda] yonaguniensis]MDF0717678.1 S41 family peptidase [[Muricauda] yonaguniensis]